MLKPVAGLPDEIVYSILVFLDTSPLTLFVGAPSGGPEWQTFFNEIFTSSMKHLIADDERVRHLTNTVARRVMSDGSGNLWKRSQGHSVRMYIQNFWISSWVFIQ